MLIGMAPTSRPLARLLLLPFKARDYNLFILNLFLSGQTKTAEIQERKYDKNFHRQPRGREGFTPPTPTSFLETGAQDDSPTRGWGGGGVGVGCLVS
jgi:hypothetical protein